MRCTARPATALFDSEHPTALIAHTQQAPEWNEQSKEQVGEQDMTNMAIDFRVLKSAINVGAAFRRISRLQPIGGRGDKIFPPTYPGERKNDPPRHVFEQRRIDGEAVWCVLIDSVQSQANRLEEALLTAVDGEDGSEPVPIPYVTVDFRGAGLEPLERVTSLDAPHRVYDAILRDSLLDGVPFMQSEEGRRLAAAKPADATALLEVSPTALVFGAWHSQGEGGGMGAKFPRTIVSEIVAVNTPVEEFVVDKQTNEMGVGNAGRRTSSRIDPLGILRKVKVFKGPSGWNTDQQSAGKGAKEARPSEINHSNITPSVEQLGVTCDYAEHRATITLAGIRRLQFGGAQRDTAGRMLVASLGLLAIAEQDVHGYALRSRCDLVYESIAPLELVNWDGSSASFKFDRASAQALYQEAYQQAEDEGFDFRSLTLKPQDKLIKIVHESRQLVLEGEGGNNENNQ